MNKITTYGFGVTVAYLLLAVASVSFQPALAAGCQTMSSDSLHSRASSFQPTIQSAAGRYGVSTSLVKAVITVESCFRPKARGSLGEKGLMQLMPATARRFNIRNGYNAWQNIHGGTRYLSYLLQRYDGNLQHTVAAYNAGEGRIKPGKRIPNKAYVSKVMQAYGKFSGGKKVEVMTVPAAASNTEPPAPAYRKAIYQTLAPQPSATALPWPDLKPDTYQVKAGDTVYEAMRRTGVPVKTLIRLNKLSAPHAIKAGQVLRLR